MAGFPAVRHNGESRVMQREKKKKKQKTTGNKRSRNAADKGRDLLRNVFAKHTPHTASWGAAFRRGNNQVKLLGVSKESTKVENPSLLVSLKQSCSTKFSLSEPIVLRQEPSLRLAHIFG